MEMQKEGQGREMAEVSMRCATETQGRSTSAARITGNRARQRRWMIVDDEVGGEAQSGYLPERERYIFPKDEINIFIRHISPINPVLYFICSVFVKNICFRVFCLSIIGFLYCA